MPEFGWTANRTLPSPVPVVGPTGVMNDALLVAVQLQPATLATTVIRNSVPAAATNPVGPSLTVNEQFHDGDEGEVGGLLSHAATPMAIGRETHKRTRRTTAVDCSWCEAGRTSRRNTRTDFQARPQTVPPVSPE